MTAPTREATLSTGEKVSIVFSDENHACVSFESATVHRVAYRGTFRAVLDGAEWRADRPHELFIRRANWSITDDKVTSAAYRAVPKMMLDALRAVVQAEPQVTLEAKRDDLRRALAQVERDWEEARKALDDASKARADLRAQLQEIGGL